MTPEALVPFAIRDLRAIDSAGKLRASFTIDLPGVGSIEGRLFFGEHGFFVKPAALKNGRGGYDSPCSLTKAFASLVCAEVVRQLERQEGATPS